MWAAVADGDVEAVRQLLSEHPELLKTYGGHVTWLHHAAWHGHLEMAKILVGFGMDVNAPTENRPDGPLSSAISRGSIDVARFLLDSGADPNVGRLLVAAINRDSHSFEMVNLLVERGADVNEAFPFGDDDGPIFTPLSWAIANEKHDIADYLRSKGAVLADDEPPSRTPRSLEEEIIAHFDDHFGPVQSMSLGEIVPDDLPITIHVIPAAAGRNCVTLFTTGMSRRSMQVPEGNEEYRFAELFVQLPRGWPLTKNALRDPNNAWPVKWLRRMAKYPYQNQTWLGGPVTIVSNGDPPERLSPNNDFTAMLLLAESDFRTRDHRIVQLYRMFPLYSEEREFELAHDAAALMRAFDRCSISFVVDLNRPNAARLSK
jgi:hypothetical protein